jgi:hypothetical protein
MCSNASGQLAQICRAIEELAGRSARGDDAGPGTAAEPGEAAAPGSDDTGAQDDLQDDLTGRLARLAAIWAMVAEADPELAKRLPGYLAEPE